MSEQHIPRSKVQNGIISDVKLGTGIPLPTIWSMHQLSEPRIAFPEMVHASGRYERRCPRYDC